MFSTPIGEHIHPNDRHIRQQSSDNRPTTNIQLCWPKLACQIVRATLGEAHQLLLGVFNHCLFMTIFVWYSRRTAARTTALALSPRRRRQSLDVPKLFAGDVHRKPIFPRDFRETHRFGTACFVSGHFSHLRQSCPFAAR